MKKEIPIFLTIDDSYVPFAIVAIKSIINNSSSEFDYKIIVLYEDVTKENLELIKELETDNLKIELKEMKEGLEQITNREENKLRCDYFTLTIYFRLFISELFKDIDKAIYIDSDVVVPGDISKLYNIDLEGNIIGACPDNSIQGIGELVDYIGNVVGSPKTSYINSGVLLMDLKQMREKNFSNKFLDILNKYHFRTIAPDQDYINAMCYGKIKYLDDSWDTMPRDDKEELKNPNLIHYNLFFKPWHYDNIQYNKYFWDTAKQTKVYDKIVDIKNNYSDDQKNLDKQCLEKLIATAVDISKNEDKTFRKLINKGIDIRL